MSNNSDNGVARRLAKNSIALAIGGLVAQIAVILVEVVMARSLGAAAYGIFATTYAFTILAILLFDVGTTWWMIQEGSRRQEEIPSLLGNSLLLKTITFLILYGIVVTIISQLPLPTDVKAFIAIFGFYALGLAVVDTLAAVYTARQEMHVNAVFQALSPVAILLVYLVAVSDGVSLSDAAIAYVAGSAFVGLIWFLWTCRKLRPVARIRDAFVMVRHSYHYGFTGILRQVFYKTDVVMIAFIAGPADAGVYAAAVKFLDLFNKIPVLASRVVLPALFIESHQKTTGKFEVLVSGYARLLVSIGAVASLVTFLAAEEFVLLVFGPEYASSASVLRILSLAMILKCMMTVGEGVLSSLERHTERWASLAAAVAMNIAMNLVLIPRFGGEGAAIATLASGLVLIVLYVVTGFGRERISRATLWFGLPLVISVAVGAAVQIMGASLLVGVPVAVVAFTALLFVTRLMSVGEIKLIRESLMPGKGSFHS